MTTPPDQVPIADTANPYALTTKQQAQLLTNDIPSPLGRLAIITTRTAGTTLTLLLTADELDSWIKVLQERRDLMRGLTVIRNGSSPLLGGTPG